MIGLEFIYIKDIPPGDGKVLPDSWLVRMAGMMIKQPVIKQPVSVKKT